MEALRKLAQAGISHNDARYHNVLWAEGKAVWIDLERATFINEIAEKEDSFVDDLRVFVNSFNRGLDTNDASFRNLALEFFHFQPAGILNYLQLLWQKPKQTRRLKKGMSWILSSSEHSTNRQSSSKHSTNRQSSSEHSTNRQSSSKHSTNRQSSSKHSTK
jgi:hypothetical protein